MKNQVLVTTFLVLINVITPRTCWKTIWKFCEPIGKLREPNAKPCKPFGELVGTPKSKNMIIAWKSTLESSPSNKLEPTPKTIPQNQRILQGLDPMDPKPLVKKI